MNFKKVEKAARKINQLLDNMRDEDTVSKIEKDLLLSYIRDMYEKVIAYDESQSKANKSSDSAKIETNKFVAHEPKPVEQTPPPVEIADVVRQEIKETAQHTQSTNEPIAAEINTPIVEEIITTPNAVKEDSSTINTNVSPELAALFESEVISELSDKLSRSPISDLTKCMGINERIFTVNELFGGDTTTFNTTMQELDKLNSLEQARDYLVNSIAVEQNWGSDSKLKKASNFIKLISRRY